MIRTIALALALLVAAAGGAEARSEKVLAYPRDQAWSAALRFLVVDEHVKVTDKDTEAGYIVFEWRDDGKLWRGSLEVVSIEADNRKAVRFVVQLADRPTWLEQQMLVRLERKLNVELGAEEPPGTPPPPKKDEPKKDEPAKPAEPAPPKDNDGPPISPTP